MTKEAELDERFSFGPPPIQTAEDAVMAFLRKEITEDEFRTACNKYGVIPGTLFRRSSPNIERIDDAYEQTIPEDIYDPAEDPETGLKARLEGVKEKEEIREKATKEAGRTSVAPGVTPVHEVGENEKLPQAQTVKK